MTLMGCFDPHSYDNAWYLGASLISKVSKVHEIWVVAGAEAGHIFNSLI